MATNFNSRVRHVQSQSAVSAGNTSNPTRDLESRTNYLKEVIDAVEAGRLLVHTDQTFAPDVLEGHVVFWNDQEKRFEQGLAGATADADSGAFVPTTASNAIGICILKDSATGGTVGTVGMHKFTPAQIENMIEGDAEPGRYYLSGVSPGKMKKQKPPVSVAVAYLLGPVDDCETDSWVFIMPALSDFLEDHVHFQYDLIARPAGVTVPTVDSVHVITDPDSSLQGWLPADDASFNSTAPADAKFGYNLAAHTSLSNVWPPIPITATLLEMFKRKSYAAANVWEDGANRVGEPYVQFTKDGIWWMSDCYDQVPWPTDLNTSPVSSSISSESASSTSSASSEAVVCPLSDEMRLVLSFIKMTFATDKTVVTSLQPDTDEPLEYVNCDGVEANTGDLRSRLKVLALTSPDEFYGGQVLKEIVDSKLLFGRGWVAEGIVAGSEEVILTSTRQRGLNPDAAISSTNPAVHQGVVTLTLQLDPTERELNPQITRLGDALEREHLNVEYIGFPDERDSAIRMRYNIPPSGLPTTPMLKIRGLLWGRAEGPFAEMTMSYYRIARPTAGTPTPIVSGDTAVTFDVVTPSDDIDGGGTDLPADNAIEIESAEFAVVAGDTVFVTLQRASDATPLFQADIGVIRIGGIIVPGT